METEAYVTTNRLSAQAMLPHSSRGSPGRGETFHTPVSVAPLLTISKGDLLGVVTGEGSWVFVLITGGGAAPSSEPR